MNNAREEYIVFSETQCIRCFTTDGVKRAMEEIGRCAVVKRITTDELSRIVTGWFIDPPADEYPDEEVSLRRHLRERGRHFSFGKSALR